MIDFQSAESSILLNPRMPRETQDTLHALIAASPALKAHVWIASSGSSGHLRVVALSKAAILASAESVNRHLQATPGDVWCRALPSFHVGGLGIEARAHLLGCRVHELAAWEPRSFADLAEQNRVTLTSLVPAQLHDLVKHELPAPASLRAVVIGGGALSPALYSSARMLGWKVLPSYGMTECCSQIATASLQSLEGAPPDLELLAHLQVRGETDGRLAFSGTSLLTGEALEGSHFHDPKIDGWFVSEDLGEIESRVHTTILRPLGRAGEIVKIGGELVSVPRLDAVLQGILDEMPGVDAALFLTHDARLGTVIHLAVDDEGRSGEIRDRFNRLVMPYERARVLHVGEIPRSPLSKILREELRKRFS